MNFSKIFLVMVCFVSFAFATGDDEPVRRIACIGVGIPTWDLSALGRQAEEAPDNIRLYCNKLVERGIFS